MTQLVDDQILGSLLRGNGPPNLNEPVFTTGCWYVRLCQAAMNGADRAGVLSRPFAKQPPMIRRQALSKLLDLPEDIGLLSMRTLGPLIGDLKRRHSLNLLGAEALAAAVHLHADVFLAAESPRLEEALRAENLRVEVTNAGLSFDT